MNEKLKEKYLKEFDVLRNDGEHCSLDDGALNKFDVGILHEFLSQLIDDIVKEKEEEFQDLILIHFLKESTKNLDKTLKNHPITNSNDEK